MNQALDAPQARPRGGRPRDPSRDGVIREAVLSLLATDGYPNLTMDAVASEAGVGKATIYRRWTSRELLINDTLSRLSHPEVAPDGMGSAEADLRALLRQYAEVLNGAEGDAASAVLTAQPFRVTILLWHAGWRDAFRNVWATAASRGEVTMEQVSGKADGTTGPVVERWLLGGVLDEEFLDRLIGTLTDGLSGAHS
jgi:AcrR family transcriptional regulator